VLLVLSTVIALLCLRRTEIRSPLWLVHPAGSFAVVLWLHASGLMLYRLLYDEFPSYFGFEERFVMPATAMLVSLQAGVFVGSTLAGRLSPGRLAQVLQLTSIETLALRRTLLVGVLATGAPAYASLLESGVSAVLAARYGEVQWSAASSSWSNVSAIAVPTFWAYLICVGAEGRRLASLGTALLACYALLPALLSGGRRDIVLSAFAAWLAWHLRRARVSLPGLAALGLLVVGLSWVLTVSRAGDSLSFEARSEALQRERGDPKTLVGHALTLNVGASVLTSSMAVFPDLHPHTLGKSYLEALGNLSSPRFLVGSMPFAGASLRFRELYYPEVSSTGLDYSLAAEAFQNFGVAGPGLVAILVGAVLGGTFAMGRTQATRSGINGWILVHLHLFVTAVWALRTDAHTTLKLGVYGALWLLGLQFVARRAVSRLTWHPPGG